jgi:aspartate/methionine/tyrosine aminotransferase
MSTREKLPKDALILRIEDVLASDIGFAKWLSSIQDKSSGVPGEGYDMGVGQYFKLPIQMPVLEATINALRERRTSYRDDPDDLPELLAEKLQKENKVKVDPWSELMVVGAISPGMYLAPLAFVDPGDEVLIIDPDYVRMEAFAKARFGKVVRIPLKERKGVLDESRWYFNPDALESRITEKSKLFMFTNPNNPVGYVYSKSDLNAIARIAKKYDLYVFCNECYERLVFNEEFYQKLVFNSIAAIPGMMERTITVQGVTKNYDMTGFRVGWIFSSEAIIKVLSFLSFWCGSFSASPFSQYGAIAAHTSPYREDYIRHVLKIYRKNINLLYKALNPLPWIECPKPMGGTFIFADITKLGISDIALAHYLLKKGIMTDYGSAWGSTGVGHLRLTIANPIEYQKVGVNKLVTAIKEYATLHKDRLLI